MTAARLPSAVDANGTVRTPRPIPMHRVRFTLDMVKDPAALSKQLTELEKAAHDGSLHGRSNPEAQGVDFEDMRCPVAGNKLYIRHSLGRFVRWRVVDWCGASTTDGPKLVCDRLDASPETTPNVLALRSYVAGFATIRVYGVP